MLNGVPASIGVAIGHPIFYSGNAAPALKARGQLILVAESLTPKEAESADLGRFQGLVLERGGSASHAVIVARSYGIPIVIGVKAADMRVTEDSTVIVDGFGGKVIVNPDEEMLRKYGRMRRRYSYAQQRFLRESGEQAVTRDGRGVEVGANIGSLGELERGFSNGAEGVLLRTELFFIGRDAPPSEEEQFQMYREVAEKAGGAPVLIRTLDVGGDKHPSYLDFPEEANPFLGLRGLRYYARNPKIIEVQLSAILRASGFGNIRLLLPMVTKTEEVDAFMSVLKRVMSKLSRRGIGYNRDVQVGALIEVPSAAEIVTEMSGQLDFFSIGTNDLIQYLEAVDRTDEHVAESFDTYHPAVWRIIARVIGQAHDRGKLVGVCGEMASDPLTTAALVGLGVDELSMAPSYIPMIKFVVRQIKRAECEGFCAELLGARNSEEVMRILRSSGIKVFQFLYEGN